MPQNVCFACFRTVRISYNFIEQYKKNRKVLYDDKLERIKLEETDEHFIDCRNDSESYLDETDDFEGKLTAFETWEENLENNKLENQSKHVPQAEEDGTQMVEKVFKESDIYTDTPDFADSHQIYESEQKESVNIIDHFQSSNEAPINYKQKIESSDQSSLSLHNLAKTSVTEDHSYTSWSHNKTSSVSIPNKAKVESIVCNLSKVSNFVPILPKSPLQKILITPFIPVKSNNSQFIRTANNLPLQTTTSTSQTRSISKMVNKWPVTHVEPKKIQFIPVGPNKMQVPPLSPNSQRLDIQNMNSNQIILQENSRVFTPMEWSRSLKNRTDSTSKAPMGKVAEKNPGKAIVVIQKRRKTKPSLRKNSKIQGECVDNEAGESSNSLNNITVLGELSDDGIGVDELTGNPEQPNKTLPLKFFCPKCPNIELMGNEGKLVHHVMINHKNEMFDCNMCSITDLNASLYLQHFITAHKYECHSCKKNFKSRHNLKMHLKRHSNVRYPCTYPNCRKTFAVRFGLKKHLEFHSGEIDYICAQCGHKSLTYDTYKYHVRMHAGRKFLCTYCGQTFLQAIHLKSHMWKHTGYKKYKCEPCDKSYTTLMSLRKHNRKHHADAVS